MDPHNSNLELMLTPPSDDFQTKIHFPQINF